jgi:hypothetical protein
MRDVCGASVEIQSVRELKRATLVESDPSLPEAAFFFLLI